MYDYHCGRCGGLVPEPMKAYGYTGKWCHCKEPLPPKNVVITSTGTTAEKETPTPKTVEEVVAEIELEYLWRDREALKDKVRTILTAQNQAAEERLRIANDEIRDVKIAHKELVKKMKEERVAADERLREVVRDMYGTIDYSPDVTREQMKAVIAKHGITNL